ncbi:hypothetical protein HAX54_028192, partial [Datura stramonium]|nr:hypothetical protein [Datura stramonium]
MAAATRARKGMGLTSDWSGSWEDERKREGDDVWDEWEKKQSGGCGVGNGRGSRRVCAVVALEMGGNRVCAAVFRVVV